MALEALAGLLLIPYNALSFSTRIVSQHLCQHVDVRIRSLFSRNRGQGSWKTMWPESRQRKVRVDNVRDGTSTRHDVDTDARVL